MNPTIEVIVLPSGQTKVLPKGFAGAACRQASEFLEKALGQVSSEQLTSEFFTTQLNAQSLYERGTP